MYVRKLTSAQRSVPRLQGRVFVRYRNLQRQGDLGTADGTYRASKTPAVVCVLTITQFMDAHMQSVPGFNSRKVKRREWQNGNTWHLRYWFRTPMFLTCEARGGRPDPPDGVHEWVAAAHRKSKTYRANPVHPTVCGLQDGRLELISNCVPPQLEYGDVVSLVFGITYVEDREDWGPVPMVSHVIRVQHANRDVYLLTSSLAAPDVDDEAGALPIGTVVDGKSLN